MTWYHYLADTPSISLKPGDFKGLGPSAPTAIGSTQIEGILMTVYMIAGIVAVIAIIIGGVRYVTSNADSGLVQSAKNMIFYATIGLIVVLMAAAITNFVVQNVTQ